MKNISLTLIIQLSFVFSAATITDVAGWRLLSPTSDNQSYVSLLDRIYSELPQLLSYNH